MPCRPARPRSATSCGRAIRKSQCFPTPSVSCPEIRNFANPETLTLFFGALNREQDWLPFLPALNAVANAAGDRLRFLVVHDQALFDALETSRKTFVPTCDYDAYLGLLAGSEISFMPLADTEFNRAKSDLKFIEAGASPCRIPGQSYGLRGQHRGRPDRHPVPRPRGAEATVAAARRHARPRPRHRRRRARTRRREADAGVSGGRAHRLVRSLWARRVELTRALVGRVPELERAAATHLAPGETVGG